VVKIGIDEVCDCLNLIFKKIVLRAQNGIH